MRASVVDLRYRMKSVLEALNRNEDVIVLYHGQEKAVITPIERKTKSKISEHPFFGMLKDAPESVEEAMENLRGRRY